MELVRILREVWSRKGLLAIVLGVSILIGLLLAYRPGLPPQSRQYQVALASSDILVDTSNSQVVDIGGRGPDLPTLTSRANLLGNLMTVGPLKNAIAKSAGIAPDDLVVVPPANAEAVGVAPAPVTTSQSRNVPDAEATILTLSTDDALPILHVVAQAPDPTTASRLSGSTIVELRRYLGSVAATQDIPAARQLVVRQFGTPLVGIATRGLPRSFALAATIFLILLGCGAIVGGSWFVRSWKQIGEAEARGQVDGDGNGDRSNAETPGPSGIVDRNAVSAVEPLPAPPAGEHPRAALRQWR
ncbi:MAG: hypothetical protein ACRDLL_11685 [Solirubrobacterales bacterium]